MIGRATAAMSAVLMVLLSVAIAEALLLVLLVLFSSILRLNLAVQLGDQILQMFAPQLPQARFAVYHAGIIGSILFSFGCGAGAAAWRYRAWEPS